MSIPGLSTLYAILKRNIDRKNDILTQRQELSTELYDNCVAWSRILQEVFEKVRAVSAADGRDAGRQLVEEQIRDFAKLDYYSLQGSSPIVAFLQEDEDFAELAGACTAFYDSALDVKRIAYGSLEREPGVFVSEHEVGIDEMVRLWLQELERALERVTIAYHRTRTVTPS